jgi:exodeoxyribonuclease VII large subunit
MQLALGATQRAPVLSVSELAQRVRTCLDANFDGVWVGGEISNLRVPASGHCYFSLKDARSQVAAVMFRSTARTVPFRLENGLEVIVRGRVSLYEARGDLQIYVDAVEPRGLGAQQLALEQLKQRLAAEGLLAAERKRPLPFWPRAVGIVTARHGAAIHDMRVTLRARLPAVRVVLRPVRVQGAGAGAEIVAALADLQAVPDVEVIIVGRGGGSLEDLWAFNEERVARAIAGSRVPVVSAVGHEIDLTLADLAADRRAPTPTAAAALVVPDQRELRARVARGAAALVVALRGHVHRERQRVSALARHLRDPRQTLRQQRLRIDELGERARRAVETAVRLERERVRGAGERLHALSPLAVLQRGYAIAEREVDRRVVRRASETDVGDELRLTFAAGWSRVRVLDRQE